jgi:hypothetical protein
MLSHTHVYTNLIFLYCFDAFRTLECEMNFVPYHMFLRCTNRPDNKLTFRFIIELYQTRLSGVTLSL